MNYNFEAYVYLNMDTKHEQIHISIPTQKQSTNYSSHFNCNLLKLT